MSSPPRTTATAIERAGLDILGGHPQSFDDILRDLDRFLAVRADFSQQPLRTGHQKRRADQKWFDPHIDETGDGTGRIIRVQG